jgi:hypothetical protein
MTRSELLQSLSTEDEHFNFLFASTANLYLESLRRTSHRGLLIPSDIPILFEMVDILTKERNPAAQPSPSRELSEEERQRVLEHFNPEQAHD